MRAKTRNTQLYHNTMETMDTVKITILQGLNVLCAVCSVQGQIFNGKPRHRWSQQPRRLFVLLNDIQPEGLHLTVTSALKTKGQ